MARTRRSNGRQGGRRTRRSAMPRQVGGQNTGLDYLLFGDMTADGKPRKPLTIANPSAATDAGKQQDTMDPFRKQINDRYANATAEQINTVIENVKKVSEDLKSVKTIPELMAEIHNKFDSLMNNLSNETKSLGKESQKDLTALILLFSSDAVMNALKAEAAEKEQQEEKAAKEKQEAEAAAAAEKEKEAEGAESVAGTELAKGGEKEQLADPLRIEKQPEEGQQEKEEQGLETKNPVGTPKTL